MYLVIHSLQILYHKILFSVVLLMMRTKMMEIIYRPAH